MEKKRSLSRLDGKDDGNHGLVSFRERLLNVPLALWKNAFYFHEYRLVLNVDTIGIPTS